MSDQPLLPNSHAVQHTSSTDTPPQTLSQEACYEEQLLKFFIGLRLLGDKKRDRFLQYIATLLEQRVNRETAKKEGNNDN